MSDMEDDAPRYTLKDEWSYRGVGVSIAGLISIPLLDVSVWASVFGILAGALIMVASNFGANVVANNG